MDNNTKETDILTESNEDSNEAVEKASRNEEARAEKTQKKKARRGLSYYFTGGVFAALLSRLTEFVYVCLCDGFFGRIFTAYKKEQRAYEDGYLKKEVLGNAKLKNYVWKTRKVWAEGFESSFLPGIAQKIIRTLLETSLKNYGNFLLSAGLYTVFSFFVRRFTEFFDTAGLVHFLTGTILIAVAVPLLTSKMSLAEALGSSVSARALFCEAFGMRDESFEVPLKQSKLRANLSIFLGMATGLLSLLISPLFIPIASLLTVAVAVILATPEIGVLVSLFSLPFLSFSPSPSVTLAAIVGVSALGYVIKLIRGKRIIRFEIVDIAVLLFSFVLFFSGVFTAGGGASFSEAILACLLISVYFLVTNMMRTEKWVNRCVVALVSSATVTAVLGVLEYLFGDTGARWLDLSYFSDIQTRVVSLFDNANVLAFYLVIIYPFALNLVFKSKARGEKFLALFASAAIALCTVFTWSRGAWLGLIVATLIYLFINTRKVIKAFFGFLLAFPLLSVIVPSNVARRFMSIGDLSDSSTYYRVLTWRGSLGAIGDSLIGGYGYGNSAFRAVYPSYAIAGIEAAEHTHSLFLQIIFAMGIVGFVAFFTVMLLFAQKNLEYFKKKETKTQSGIPSAAFTAVIAAVVMGLFDNIWYNNRVLFLFFAVMGIALATIRISDENARRRNIEVASDCSSAYIDLE